MQLTHAFAVAAASFAAVPALAQVTTTTDEILFFDGLVSPLVVNFDGVDDVEFTAAEAFAGVDLGFFTVTTDTLSGFNGDVDITNEILQIFIDDNFGGAASITLTLDAPVTAFGADFGVPATVNGDTPIVIDGVSTTFAQAGLVSSGFLGFNSVSPFTTITFGPEFDNLSLDNLVFDVVPEPTSLATLGLGAIAMLRRRR